MTEELKPGDYIGLYIDNGLIYTGVLKDIGKMASGRTVYQYISAQLSRNPLFR